MSKRINISVPDAEYIHWQNFKKQCQKNKTSVSKEVMKLVKKETKPTADDLPDWLK